MAGSTRTGIMNEHREANTFNPAKVLLITRDPSVQKAVEATLRSVVPRAEVTPLRDYPSIESIQAITAGASPALILVDADASVSEAVSFLHSTSSRLSDQPLVVLHGSADPDTILQLMRSGASDLLLTPISEQGMSDLLRRLSRSYRSVAASVAEVYCIVPSKGACGATTLACNLAATVHRGFKKRVLLMDLDGLAGMVAFQFKANSSYSLLDALARVQGMDEDVWRGLICHTHGIDLLLAPEDPENDSGYLRGIDALMTFARAMYDVIVVDAGGPPRDATASILCKSDRIFLVTTNELAGLQAAQRALHQFDQLRLERSKVRVVVNRLRKGSGVSVDVIKTALHLEDVCTIPEDSEAARRAVMEGRPLAPSSSAGAAIRGLAGEVLGERPATPHLRPSVLRSLLSKLRG